MRTWLESLSRLNRDSPLKKTHSQSFCVQDRCFWQHARPSFFVVHIRSEAYCRAPALFLLTVIREIDAPIALHRFRDDCVTITDLSLLARNLI
ncbi:hypothetical protein TNCV_2094201 [Trichonephila clavipes]|nr:hypothetical protein TNCV_2094201 [Trichonephila clavipes]